VLAPGGRAVVGFLPKEFMVAMRLPSDIFTMREPEEVTTAMERAGFVNVEVKRPKPTKRWNVIVGTRPVKE
jgi:hypothetical protein